MIRLLERSKYNSPEAYDKIFKERTTDWQDKRRWKTLLKHFKGGNLIDLGCLDSEISQLVKDSPGWYLGIDQAGEAVDAMQKRFGSPVTKFQKGDLYNTKLETNTFDYAVLGEVLEHMERPRWVVQEAFELLRPGGVLAISVPLEEALEPGAVDGDRHLWSFDKNDMITLLSPHSDKIAMKVLRSKWFPYKYCWPQLICWAIKK